MTDTADPVVFLAGDAASFITGKMLEVDAGIETPNLPPCLPETSSIWRVTTLPESEIDRGIFRTVLGHFASGVAVVTGMDGAEPVGFTCQSFFSLSIDPPLIAIAPGRSSTSWPRIEPAGCFSVSILSDGQEHLARGFAASGADKFQGVGWTPGRTGAPRLADALAWVDCQIEDVHDAGDHVLVIGSVKALEGGRGEPLVFYRAGFGNFQP